MVRPCGTQYMHTFQYPQAWIMFFTLLFTTEFSYVSFLVVLLWLFQVSLATLQISIVVTGVVGWPEGCLSLNCVWPLTKRAIHEAQWPSAFIYDMDCTFYNLLVNICYWFFLCHKELSNSPVLKMYVTTPWNFDHLLYMWENIFLFCAAVARRTCRINHKKCNPFLLILTEV